MSMTSFLPLKTLLYSMVLSRSQALSNAIRKQYGHPVFFVKLEKESGNTASHSISVPPCLPPHGIEDYNNSAIRPAGRVTSELNLKVLRIFLKEFVTMNLIPWMEKLTLGWMELVSFACLFEFKSKLDSFQCGGLLLVCSLPPEDYSEHHKVMSHCNQLPTHQLPLWMPRVCKQTFRGAWLNSRRSWETTK